MLDIFKKFSYLLERREKIQVISLFFLLLIGGILEMLGVGFVVPFISLVSQPELIQEQPILNRIYLALGSPSSEQFLVIICLIYLLIYVGKNAYVAIMYHLQHRFIFNKQRKVADKLLNGYLGAPYTFHLQRNTAVLIRNLTQEVNQLFMGVLIPLVMLCTEVTVLTGLVLLLIFLQPMATLAVAIGLGIASFIFYNIFQKQLSESGKKRQYHSGQVIQQINQGLGGVKETKLLGRENFFLKRHSHHRSELVKSLQFVQTIQQLPRLYFETLAVFGLLGIVLITVLQETATGEVLPTVSLFAAAAFRLMPSLNRVMNSVNRVRFGSHALDVIVYEFRVLEDEKNLLSKVEVTVPSFKDKLTLDAVSYHYPGSEEEVLNRVSITISQGKSVGLIGSSGAGKTTLVDVILGLLRPTEGRVLVDGVDIQQGLRGWQSQIGYIPQSIYLCDDTLRGNIAFGIPEEEISDEQVWSAVRSAQLQELVERLPQGLDTVVGERGVRLSGGQRQRVGIARALYHNPQVLVMDEATAALDNETEAGIMEAVEKLSGEKTLIMIAHRLTTVKNCDCLYLMERGKVVDQGSYEELRDRNASFMRMASGIS
ncbi:ABC transporter ATP-binding protein [Dactylococcopsis salina]|uniref:ABC-type multidrug transport system, ATPase and permease component n=1 Tax=Dactylococcopsis salina (strain PCC 8305) TaxID=13035 RepID=K9YSF4_DACS8|nr:ABC transporter ATP-binding protein [Dactylococcopsis salina]AFZ49048.1 ABC-type multidrug transport system, ATPase and permease component [Dactylococcopsis salina PCC 8305]